MKENQKTTSYLVGYTIRGDSEGKNALRRKLSEKLEGLPGAERVNESMLKYPDDKDFIEKVKCVCRQAEQDAGNVSFEESDFVKVYYNPHLRYMTPANTGQRGFENRIIEELVYGRVD